MCFYLPKIFLRIFFQKVSVTRSSIDVLISSLPLLLFHFSGFSYSLKTPCFVLRKGQNPKNRLNRSIFTFLRFLDSPDYPLETPAHSGKNPLMFQTESFWLYHLENHKIF